MQTLVNTLLAAITVSLTSLVGALFMGVKEDTLSRVISLLVGFASGSMMGGAFLHLLPEALETSQNAFSYAVLGVIVFFVMEKFLRWRHCHRGKCEVHSFGYLNLVGDGIHNFVDGMTIAAAFIVAPIFGLITTLMVMSHEIPQELGDFGVLVYAGFGRKKALFYNFISQCTAIIGALGTLYLSDYIVGLNQLLISFAAGGFIYIAGTDLMPELHKETEKRESILQVVMILLGIFLMWILRLQI